MSLGRGGKSWFTGKMDNSAFTSFVWVSLLASLGIVLNQQEHMSLFKVLIVEVLEQLDTVVEKRVGKRN